MSSPPEQTGVSMPAESGDLSCRMYEPKYPEVDDLVVVKVKQIAEMGAYVSLLEYNNIEGMILLSELSRRRIRSINKLIRVGRNEVVVVLRVDKEKGYIDLSKRRVSPEDVKKMEEKFNKSKTVHSIMKHLAETHHKKVEDLYKAFGWPLYAKFGHAYDAFKAGLQDPDKIFEGLDLMDLKEPLLQLIERRLTPKAVKVRADVEVTCFDYEGIDSIKAALKAGEAVSTDEEFPINIKLVAPPLYVLYVTSLDKEKGIETLEKAITAIKAKITELKGNLVVKAAPRSVTESEDKEFDSMMAELERQNREVDGDDDGSGDDGDGPADE